MSTISVANITTANGTTNLSLASGNTSAGSIIVLSAGGIVAGPNSSVNAITISTGTIANTIVTNSTGVFLSANLSGTFSANISGNVNIDSGTFFVDGTNNRVGIGNTTPAVTLQVTGTMNVSSNTFNLGSSTSAANGFTYLPNGIKMVWGVQSASVNTTTTATASFVSSFTTLYSFSGVVLGQNTIITVANTTSLVWRNISTAAAASQSFYFTAIGV